jgi:hypothetical protein
MAEPADELSKLNATQLKDLREALEHLADHMAQRIEYAESRRSAVATLGGALFAGGLALLPYIGSQTHYLPLRIALICVAAIWLLFGGITWLLYARQTNFRYPFTEVAKTSKWFYRYALEDYKAFTAPWHTIQSNREREQGKEAFNAQWEHFRDEQIRLLSDPRSHILQDLQQIYLLHVNERYKNLFLSQIRSVLSLGIILGIVLGLVGFGAGFLFVQNNLVKRQQQFVSGELVVDAFWRNTGNIRSSSDGAMEIQYLVNINITNNSKDVAYKLTEDQITLIDNFGMRIPVAVESQQPSSISIEPGTKTTIAVLFWIPLSLESTLNHIEVPT